MTLVSEGNRGNGALARGLWKAMRPHQWSKNVLVFVPLLLSHQYGDAGMLLAALTAFVCVSILASSDFPISDPLSFYYTLGVTVLWTTLNVALHLALGLSLALLLRISKVCDGKFK